MKQKLLTVSVAGLLAISPVVYAGFRVIHEGEAPKPSDPLQIATEVQENVQLHGQVQQLEQQQALLRAEQERTAAELERVRTALAAAEVQRYRALDEMETMSMRFAFGATAFIPTAEESAALIRKAQAADHVNITGYTDSWGRPIANQRIALARAESAKRYLVISGVADTKLTAASGAGNYAAPNKTATGRAANRRVVFAFKSPAEHVATAAAGAAL